MADKMTLAQFGQLIKSRYPGAYDAKSDEEVGQAMMDKHPGVYSDRVDETVNMNHLFGGNQNPNAVHDVSQIPALPHTQGAGEAFLDEALTQGGNVAKGFAGAFTGIPGMIHEAGGIAKDALTGNASGAVKRTGNMVSGAVHGMVDPIATSARGMGALVAPGSVQAPSQADWEQAAKDAGAQAGSAVIGKVAESVPTSASELQQTANKLRAIKSHPGAVRVASAAAGAPIGMAVGGPVGAAAGGAVGAALGPKIIGALADPAASIVEKLAAARAYFDSDPAAAQRVAPTSNPVEATPELQQLQQSQQAMNQPNLDVKPAAAPSAPIEPNAAVQQLQQSQQAMNQPNLETKPAPGPSQQIEPNAEMQQMQQNQQAMNQPDMQMKPPAGPSEQIEPNAEMQQIASQPQAHPEAGGAATSRDIMLAREAILRNGAPRSTATLLKVSRNVPELLNTVPELKGIPAGPRFDTRLHGAFNNIAHELKATEESIPDNTMVPTTDAVSKLKDLETKYIETNQTSAVRAIDKVKSFLTERPSMAWADFIKAKRAFFNEIKLSSAPGRDAYQIFKKLSNDVSPELGDLNQKYFVVKSAIENAAIDMKTGERIRNIGKPAEAPGFQQTPSEASAERPLRMPL